MRTWVEKHGAFVPLDDQCDAIMFVERTRFVMPSICSVAGR
jgi:hypothetical protein